MNHFPATIAPGRQRLTPCESAACWRELLASQEFAGIPWALPEVDAVELGLTGLTIQNAYSATDGAGVFAIRSSLVFDGVHEHQRGLDVPGAIRSAQSWVACEVGTLLILGKSDQVASRDGLLPALFFVATHDPLLNAVEL